MKNVKDKMYSELELVGGILTKDVEQKLIRRIPMLGSRLAKTSYIFSMNTMSRLAMQRRKKIKPAGQFRSPGQGMRGKGYGLHHPGGPQGYHYSQGYHNRSGYASPMQGGKRLSEGGEGYLMGSEDSYGYQQMASDDSRDTQHSSSGDMGQHQQTGFSGSFGEGSGLGESQGDTFSQEKSPGNELAGGDPVQSPPDIKYEATPMPFIKPDEFELIEIDPDEEEDI